MRIIQVFPIIFAALFSRAVPSTSINPFETVSIGPLCLGKETVIQISSRNRLAQVRVHISNDLYSDKIIADTNMIGGTRTFTYSNEFTRATNEVWVSYGSRRDWISMSHVTMTPISTTNRYITDNQSLISRNNLNVHYYETDSWATRKLNYSFENFDGLYIPDYYHKIRLEDFKINIDEKDRGLFSCIPSLVITNVDGFLNDVSSKNSVEFPLKAVTTTTGFTFELQDILYVHKETLMLSKIAKDGYVPTKHIYLPRNQMQNQAKYKAYFAFQNFGIDNDLVRHNFEMHALKNIIGDCQNSEYCIQRL